MSLRHREKQSLYRSLGQLLRSGVTFPAALQSLVRTSRGRLKRLLVSLNASLADGKTVGEAFAAERPTISEMEVSIVSAVERSGNLERGLAQLATYFGALATARATVIKKSSYPIFLLHLGILLLGVRTFMAAGLPAYLREVGTVLAIFYAAVGVIAVAIPLLSNSAAGSAALDSLLRKIPVIGSIRKNFAVARFCATYEMQLGAGVNVMDALKAAARASRSGLIAGTVQRAVPEVLNGAQVGPLLAIGGAFPDAMIGDFGVGEQTGRLDEELERLAAEHQGQAISSLDTLTEWLPKLIYLGICGYMAYRIVSWYGGYLREVQDIADQI
ncbi:MAG TPA: type II secretion system F family protein [Chthoniobacteraceae bacterium]